jgi:murein DD-endopeptidase MepM/ murein hydrolase activator NlpD
VNLTELAVDEGEAVAVVANGHRDVTGVWRVYDQLPRRPDRPEEYDRYVYPVAPGMGRGGPLGRYVVSGYDLDRPDALQRRSSHLKHVGHGAVDLPQHRGAPISVVTLEHQEGDAIVVFDGVLFGNTVITLHHVRESGSLRDYAVLYGHLEATAVGVDLGKPVAEHATIAFVGDSGSPNLVHLHLEVRRIREEINARDAIKQFSGGAILMNHVAVVCDPRNVLQLRPISAPAQASSQTAASTN